MEQNQEWISEKNKKSSYASKHFLIILFLHACIVLPSGGTGNIGIYTFDNYSKREVNIAIKTLFNQYPQYVPPEKYTRPIIHNWQDLSSPESRRFNNDTVQFHFYLKTKEGEEILYWTSFGHLEDNWLNKPSKLCLIGYEKEEAIEKMKTRCDFGNSERIRDKKIRQDLYIKLFESEIVSKIRYILEGRSGRSPGTGN